MAKYQISLMSMLLLTGALPIWLVLIVGVPMSPGYGGNSFRYLATPIALGGITVVIRRLLGSRRDAWALSMLLAGIIAWGSLLIIARIVNR
jgi:hypothetical protein